MKQIHIIYGSVLAALLVIVPTTIVLAQMQVLSDLSIASVNVSQNPITRGSDQEVFVAVVDNNSADDVPADGIDVMLTVSYASGMERKYTQTTDQNGNADFIFPIGASSKPGTFNIVVGIPGSNISKAQSFEVIPITSEGDSEEGTTSEGDTTGSGSGVSTTSEEEGTTSEGDTTGSGSGVSTTSEGDSEEEGTTIERNRAIERFPNRGGTGSTTGGR
jgi:hypothetical protein